MKADACILAMGIRPNTEFLQDAGLEMFKGALLTNQALQTNDPDIYAVGDCAMVTNRITGKPQWSPMGSTANIAGRAAAQHLAGKTVQYPGVLGTGVAKLAGFCMGRTGLLEQAAREACLHDAIGSFQAGYETVVGERGVTLSGGQKQRTAIARTLLEHAPIMVFDDALSAVDAKTDEAIRGRLREAAGGSTMILIAHRVATLMQADRIIVLRDGRIVEQGAPEALLAQGGLFARTARMQSAEGEEEAE